MFQLFGEGDRWIGEAEDIFSARRACEELVLEDGEEEARIEDDKGLKLESLTLGEYDRLEWVTSDLVRQYDGRAI